MIIKRIELENLKVAGTRAYDLEPLTLITGANSSGKTAILDGVVLALTGGHPIGKTAAKLRQLAAGEPMAVKVVPDVRFSPPFLRFSLAGSTIDRSAAGHWTMLTRAELYADAGPSARYNLLGSAHDLDQLLEAVAKAKDDITGATRELRRIEATVKTEGLELAKLEARADSDAEAAINSALARQEMIQAREVLADSSAAALKSAEPRKEPNGEFAGLCSGDLRLKWEGADLDLRDIANEFAALPCPPMQGMLDTAAECEKHECALSDIRQEWKAAHESKHSATLKALGIAEAKAGMANIAITQDLSRCPLCGTTNINLLEHLQDVSAKLKNDIEAYREKLESLDPPVSQGEIDAARREGEIAKQALIEAETQTAVREARKKELDDARARCDVLRQAFETSVIRESWAGVKQAREAIEKSTRVIESNADAEARNTVRVGLGVSVGAAKKRIGALKDELEGQKTTLANDEGAYRAAAAGALGDLLATAEGLLAGIVSGRVTNHGSEVVIERDDAEITWAAMSGSERLAIGCALKIACSSVEGLLLVDELGVLTVPARVRFLDNIAAELKAGRIHQALVVVPGGMVLDGWHAIEAGSTNKQP